MKSIDNATLYDLMAEDMTVYLSASAGYGIDLVIEGEDEVVVDERAIDPVAAASFAKFCKDYLDSYERLTKTKVA